jgi:hypothetical protein
VNGSYAVELTENGCVDTSACVVINTIGLGENTLGQYFTVFPNPNNGQFTVDLGEEMDFVTVKITDVTGKVLNASEHKGSKTIQLNLDEPSGVYFLSVKTASYQAVVRIVKE